MNFLNAGVSPGERAYAAGAPFLTRQKGWKKRQGKMWGHKAPVIATLWCFRWCRLVPYIVSLLDFREAARRLVGQGFDGVVTTTHFAMCLFLTG